MAVTPEPADLSAYCRQLESYLCRKNDGHLIRIVGPSFEQVSGWAARGIPLTIAQRGIDRYFERYYAKGPRRRPVQIQFCEPDVFDVFDEWRRAVGVPARSADTDAESDAMEAARRHGSLPAHLDRVIARLTIVRGGEDRSLDDTVDRLIRELDGARSTVKTLRGDARSTFLTRLQELDAEIVEVARTNTSAETLRQLETEADEELAPFRDRMAREVYDRSRRSAVDRLIRERRRLPVIAFD